jgi:hypothetical protein
MSQPEESTKRHWFTRWRAWAGGIATAVVTALAITAANGTMTGLWHHFFRNPIPGPTVVHHWNDSDANHDAMAVLADPGSGGVRGVAFSFDNHYLATADGNGSNTYVWARPARSPAP